MYKNEVDMPKEAPRGRMESGMGCESFKGQADPIAYGQAGKKGCESDRRKIDSQMMHYDWGSADNY